MPKDLHEPKGLYAYFKENPDEAHRRFFGPESGMSRRGFFTGAGAVTAGSLLGMTIPFYANMPRGLVPAAFAAEDVLVGKDGLTLLNDRPINAETPAHLLDDAITPTARHFIRNNGLPPEEVDAEGWMLTIDGLVENPARFSIEGPALKVRGDHEGTHHRVRGKRPGVFRPSGPGQPMDGRGRRLR